MFMKGRRTWEQMNIGKRPLCYDQWPAATVRPATFQFERSNLEAPALWGTARIYYENGWTAIALYNSRIYFADETLTFDAMMELISSRFGVSDPIQRAYVD